MSPARPPAPQGTTSPATADLWALDPAPALQFPEAHPGAHARLLGYNLFLAIFPSAADAQRIAALADDLRARHALQSTRQDSSRLHISLCALDGFPPGPVPGDSVAAALAVAATVRCPAFPLVFERALTFPRKNVSRSQHPYVLRTDQRSDHHIARLRQECLTAARRAGLKPQPSGTPHMTLLYDTAIVPDTAFPALHWTASRFALVLSHVGAGHHQWLGEWPLR